MRKREGAVKKEIPAGRKLFLARTATLNGIKGRQSRARLERRFGQNGLGELGGA